MFTIPFENNQTYTCQTCSLAFNDQAQLDYHQPNCPLLIKESLHVCHCCGELFNNKSDLTEHISIHQTERQHICVTCKCTFKRKVDLQNHMVCHRVERPYKCTHCASDFQRPSSLTNHLKIHGLYSKSSALVDNKINKRKCNNNNLKNSNFHNDHEYGNIKKDLKEQDKNKDSNLQKHELDTPENGLKFMNNDKFDLQDAPIFVDGENKQEIVEFNMGVEHEVIIDGTDRHHRRPYACSNCDASFARAKALEAHLKLHEDPIIIWECDSCDQTFSSHELLYKHNNTKHHDTSKVKMKDDDYNNSVKHTCLECQKNFATKQKLYRHLWIHRKRQYDCEVCGMNFSDQLNLDSHRLKLHPADSQFVCQECGKSFVSRQGLWEHGRVHGGGNAGLLWCHECNKSFASRQGYLIHTRTHTGERPYGCRYCMKAFRDGGTLRKHERIHTGERPHVCPLCNRAFNQKVVLREHVRWVHAANKKNDTTLPFACEICGQILSDREELCAHVVKHSDDMAAHAKAIKGASSTTTSPVIIKKIKKTTTTIKKTTTTKKTKDIFHNKRNSKNTTSNIHNCDMCGKNFKLRSQLLTHVRSHI